MSGGTTNSSTQIPDWAQNYMKQTQGFASNVANTPYQAYDGNKTAGFTGDQNQAMDLTRQRALGGSALSDAGKADQLKTIQGGYFGANNEALTGAIDKAQGDVVRNYNLTTKPAWDSAMRGSGSYGNSGVAEAASNSQRDLAGQLAGISTNMRYGDYNNERNRQVSASQGAPGLAQSDYYDFGQLGNIGQQQQQLGQSYLNNDYQTYLDKTGYGARQLGLLQGAAGLGAQAGSTGTQSTSSNPFAQLLGAASLFI
jgi:hypothetical protein